jgi:drug/metabolite transporter (DMT)-like permease
MTAQATLIWLLKIVADTIGQLSFKAAANIEEDHWLAHWKAMMSDKWMWAGIGSYFVEFFLWLALLSLVPLSLAVLLASFNILTITLGGRLIFKEKLTPRRCLAISLIAVGVALVGWA